MYAEEVEAPLGQGSCKCGGLTNSARLNTAGESPMFIDTTDIGGHDAQFAVEMTSALFCFFNSTLSTSRDDKVSSAATNLCVVRTPHVPLLLLSAVI